MDIDLLLRGGALSLLALLASQLWRSGGAQRLLSISCLCGCAYLFSSRPEVANALGPARWLVLAIAATGPFWFMVATRRAFGEPAALGASTLALLAGAVAALALAPSFTAGSARFALSLAADLTLFSFFAAALFTAWRGLGDDLDPQRRSMRFILLGASAGLGVLIATGALWANVAGASARTRVDLGALVAGGALAVTWAYCFLAMRLVAPAPTPRPASANRSQLAQQISAAFATEKLHRRSDLTLSVVARALEAPEHQVRAAINAELGHKNFSSYVNAFRLEEVKQALADPAQTAVPITTIALDAGFGSVASFNRVFRADAGVSPSEFRRAALDI